MYFSRADNLQQHSLSNRLGLWFAAVMFLGVACFVMDATLQANGVYGQRSFVAETVTDKRITGGSRRRSPSYNVFFRHQGQQHKMQVLSEQYAKINVGDRLRMIIVPTGLDGPTVFLDTPGLKLDPASRFIGFGLIIAVHFGGLFLLFHALMARARAREAEAAESARARRLGFRPSI